MPRGRILKAVPKPKDFGKMPWTEEFRATHPTKILAKYVDNGVRLDDLRDFLFAEKLVDFRKANLMVDVYKNEQGIVRNDSEVLLEVNVPVCENQCADCDQVRFKRTHKCYKNYFDALLKDVMATRELIIKKGYFVKSVCFVGNVMVFDCDELEKLMSMCAYALSEICVEVSDVGLVTEEKLQVLKKFNVRFVLNALTFNTVTLRLLNKHSHIRDVLPVVQQIVKHGFDLTIRLAVGIGKERELQLGRNIIASIEMGADNIELYARACPKLGNVKNLEADKVPYQRKLHEYVNDYMLEQGFTPFFLYCTEVDGGCFENIGFKKNKKCKYIEDRILGVSSVLGCGLGAENVRVKNLQKITTKANTTHNLEEYLAQIEDIIKERAEFFG